MGALTNMIGGLFGGGMGSMSGLGSSGMLSQNALNGLSSAQQGAGIQNQITAQAERESLINSETKNWQQLMSNEAKQQDTYNQIG